MTASYMTGEKKKWRIKNAYTKHMYTFWKGILSSKMKGRILNKNKEGNAKRGKYCQKRTEVQKKKNHLYMMFIR